MWMWQLGTWDSDDLGGVIGLDGLRRLFQPYQFWLIGGSVGSTFLSTFFPFSQQTLLGFADSQEHVVSQSLGAQHGFWNILFSV